MNTVATTAPAISTIITTSGCGIVSGLLLKIVYDWLTSGKEFVSMATCKSKQENCPLDKKFIEQKTFVNQKLQQHDRLLREINQNGKKQLILINRLTVAVSVMHDRLKRT